MFVVMVAFVAARSLLLLLQSLMLLPPMTLL
jgi:hypothetical protein